MNHSFRTDGSLETTRGWFGDVKYHMGALYKGQSGMQRFLAYNPSHLEVVNPVVTGQTRAAQEKTDQPGHTCSKIRMRHMQYLSTEMRHSLDKELSRNHSTIAVSVDSKQVDQSMLSRII